MKKIILFCCVFFLVHEAVIVMDGLVDDKESQAQFGVIFGSKVNEDGSLSPRLKARLDKGYSLFQENVIEAFYVSGGLGKEGFQEGSVMAKYLEEQGVPNHLIQIDNQGTTTRRTALNFVRDNPGQSTALVVSQYFHVTRCKLAFKQVGISQVKGIACDHHEFRDAYSAFREFFGFYKYLLLY